MSTWGWSSRGRQSLKIGGEIGSVADSKITQAWPKYEADVLRSMLRHTNVSDLSEERAGVFLDKVTENYQAAADGKLKEEFIEWLQGRHDDNERRQLYENDPQSGKPRRIHVFDHKRHGQLQNDWSTTSWGKTQLTHLPGVRDFLRDIATKERQNEWQMNLLAEHGPQNLEEAWMYFKHWVKGRPLNNTHLSTLDFINNRPLGNRSDIRTKKPYPYGDVHYSSAGSDGGDDDYDGGLNIKPEIDTATYAVGSTQTDAATYAVGSAQTDTATYAAGSAQTDETTYVPGTTQTEFGNAIGTRIAGTQTNNLNYRIATTPSTAARSSTIPYGASSIGTPFSAARSSTELYGTSDESTPLTAIDRYSTPTPQTQRISGHLRTNDPPYVDFPHEGPPVPYGEAGPSNADQDLTVEEILDIKIRTPQAQLRSPVATAIDIGAMRLRDAYRLQNGAIYRTIHESTTKLARMERTFREKKVPAHTSNRNWNYMVLNLRKRVADLRREHPLVANHYDHIIRNASP